MKYAIYTILLGTLSLIFNCGGGGASSPAPSSSTGSTDMSGFTVTDYANVSGLQLAKSYHDKDGFITSEGPLYNGMREGTWITYHTGRDTGKIKSVTNYHKDLKSGVALEFATNGSVNKRVDYDGDVIHGVYAEYKYNRPLKYADYTQGELDGMYKTFYNNGKLQQSTEYKKGKKDGKSIFYNEEEQIIMEYVYKKGDKISGGKVTPPPVAEDK